MAVILVLTLFLLLFCVLFISIAQTGLPLTIINDKNLEARITNKVDEALDKKKADIEMNLLGSLLYVWLVACLCVLALVALQQLKHYVETK